MRETYFKNLPSYLIIALVFLTSIGKANSQSLSAGDLLFTGYDATPGINNAATADRFSFILLVPIASFTTIYFTDRGYFPSGWQANSSQEGVIKWENTGGPLQRGTEVTITAFTATVNGVPKGTVTSVSGNNSISGMNLGNADQIIAFQNSTGNPTEVGTLFLAGIHWGTCLSASDAAWDASPCTGSTSNSAMPPGLTAGDSAVWMGTDEGTAYTQAAFNGGGSPFLTGGAMRSALTNKNLWVKSGWGTTVIAVPSGNVSFLQVPTISQHPSDKQACAGSTVTYTISAANSPSSYKWQEDSGSGFVDLSNTGIYSNVFTSTLTITGVPISLNGYIYRCVASNSAGSVNSGGALLNVTNLTNISTYQSNVNCFGGSNGTASVNMGGTGNFTYDWSPGNPAGDGTSYVSGLTAGTWTVDVTDSNGCTATKSIVISQPSQIVAIGSQTDASGNGQSDGIATVSVSGGSGVYNYAWFPAGGNNASATNLVPGSYICFIFDTAGCSTSKSFTIVSDTTPPSVSISSTANNPTIVNSIPVTVTFSESVTGFSESDIVVGNGNVSNFSGSGASYTFTVIPLSAGSVTINIAGGIATDVAGNGNTAASQFSIVYAPVYCGAGSIFGDFFFSEVAIGTLVHTEINSTQYSDFTNLSVDLAKGSQQLVRLSTSSSENSIHYIVYIDFNHNFEFEPNEAVLTTQLSDYGSNPFIGTFTVPQDAVLGATRMRIRLNISNGANVSPCGNSDFGAVSDYTVNIINQNDMTPPMASITSTASNPTGLNVIPVNVTFNETVFGFTPEDVIVGNGSISNFSGNGTTYSFNVIPAAPGLVTVNIPSGVVTDGAANLNTAATQFSIVYTPQYCSGNSSYTDIRISNVTIGTLNNTSSDMGGYEDFSNLTVDFEQGSSQNISLRQNTSYGLEMFIVFVDYNHNFEFEESEKVLVSPVSSYANTPYSGSFVVPQNALLGPTRMRIRLMYNEVGPNYTACGNAFIGQVEDYTVIITVPDCSSTTTWSDGAWNPFAPVANQKAVIASDYSEASNLAACELTVTNNAVVAIPSGYTVNVKGSVKVESGSLSFSNNARLLQDPLATTNTNTGNITLQRDVMLRRLDYVYWGSPVAGMKLKTFSPQTVNNRFYRMNESTNTFIAISDVVDATPQANPIHEFEAAKGYMIRSSNFLNPAVNAPLELFEGKFTGVPNNGNYSVDITHTATPTSKGFNLISNPYPSPISALDFVNSNTDIGTLYFWTHGDQNSATNNYATWNKLGVTPISGPTSPNGFIQTGQGFMVHASNILVAGTKANFTNAMRRDNDSNQFLELRMW